MGKSINIDVSNFDEITRGYALNNEIFFYHGNFDVNEKVIEDAKIYTKIIVKNLILKIQVFTQAWKLEMIGTRWKPKVKIFLI